MRSFFAGGVGRDDAARTYTDLLEARGVVPLLAVTSETEPTATTVCLVTPDGQRTMRTCLGAALLYSKEFLPEKLSTCKLLHCEGYCLHKPALLHDAIKHARAAGAVISLDLASFEVVQACKVTLFELWEAGLIDVLFFNEDEAAAMMEVLPTSLHIQGEYRELCFTLFLWRMYWRPA